jgi:CRP/FNR family cyclic AMP-dependent transcriptional regulator
MASAKSLVLEQGHVLFQKGDPGDGCYWLNDGIVKVTVSGQSGHQRILSILGKGAIVGELAMIDGLPRSATVEAVRQCRLTFVPRSAFESCLKCHPEIDRYLVNTLALRLRKADEEAAAASFLTVRGRIARALLQLADHMGMPSKGAADHIELSTKFRQSDLAAMAGVARESISRTLSDWKRRRLLGNATRGLYVIDRTALEREAQFEG